MAGRVGIERLIVVLWAAIPCSRVSIITFNGEFQCFIAKRSINNTRFGTIHNPNK